MSNYLCANEVEVKGEGISPVPMSRMEIDMYFDNKLYHFTRDGSEPLEKVLKRLKLKLAESMNSSISRSRKAKAKGKKQGSLECDTCDFLPVDIVDQQNKNLLGSITVSHAFVNGNSLRIGEATIAVQRDPCRVIKFQAPEDLIVGCPCVPLILESRSLTAPHTQLKWKWRIVETRDTGDSVDRIEAICTEMVFTPDARFEGMKIEISCVDAIGNVLTQTCPEVVQSGWRSRLEKSLSDANDISITPLSCPEFEHLNRQLTTGAFRVVSYNILHDSYASTDIAREKLYPYVEMKNLDIRTRKIRIAKEILDFNPTIIALQEVGRSIFDDYFLPLFQCHEYQGYFEAKSRIETKKGVSNTVALDDGCAIFWNTQKFECLASYSVPLTSEFFSDPLVESFSLTSEEPWLSVRKKIDSSRMIQKSFNRLVMKGIIVHLRPKNCSGSTKRDLLVANTHLFWHPSAKHIRLIQVHMLLSLVNAMQRKKYPNADVVVCGDLNSMPDGGVFELTTTGKIEDTHIDWDDCILYNKEKHLGASVDIATLIGLTNEFENDKNFRFTLSGMRLQDACKSWKASTYTNFTPKFKGRLDYIFHTENVSCIRTLKNPSNEEMAEEIAIPSSKYPSDHVAVVSDLELI